MRNIFWSGVGLAVLTSAGAIVLTGGVPDLSSSFVADATVPTELEQNFQSALTEAQRQANSGNMQEAIELTASIPSNSQHAQEAQQLTNQWAKSLLQEATLAFKSADLDTALTKLSAIPASASVHSQSQELQASWSQHKQVLTEISDHAKSEDWAAVLASAGKLDKDLSQSPKVQELLTAALSGLPQEATAATQVAASKTLPSPEVPQIPLVPSVDSAPVELSPVGAGTQQALAATEPDVVFSSLPVVSSTPQDAALTASVAEPMKVSAAIDSNQLMAMPADVTNVVAPTSNPDEPTSVVPAQSAEAGSSIPSTSPSANAVNPEALQGLSKPEKTPDATWQGRVDKPSKIEQGTGLTQTTVAQPETVGDLQPVSVDQPEKDVPTQTVSSVEPIGSSTDEQVPRFEEFAAQQVSVSVAPPPEIPATVPSFEEFAQAQTTSVEEPAVATAFDILSSTGDAPAVKPEQRSEVPANSAPVPVATAPTINLTSCLS